MKLLYILSMIEIWKDIKDYEGLYQASTLLNIRSLDRYVKHPKGGTQLIKGRIISQCISKKGYLTVRLHKDGKSKLLLVHRIIAETFIPNPENKPCVDHINTIRTDNRIENLRWVTEKENQNNTSTKQHLSDGIKGKHINRKDLSKPVYQYTLNSQFIAEYPSVQEAARQNNVAASNICACLKGKTKSSCNSHWFYSPPSSVPLSGSGLS